MVALALAAQDSDHLFEPRRNKLYCSQACEKRAKYRLKAARANYRLMALGRFGPVRHSSGSKTKSCSLGRPVTSSWYSRPPGRKSPSRRWAVTSRSAKSTPAGVDGNAPRILRSAPSYEVAPGRRYGG